MELPNSTVTKVTAEQSEVLLPKTLTEEVVAHLNSGLADEYAAHYFYRGAANWCQGVGYISAAAFFAKEAATELEHAEKLQKYMVDWNATPLLPSVKFTAKFAHLIDVVNKAYTIEYTLGNKYNEMSLKLLTTHIPTFDFLQDFREIQTQSIAEYSDLLNAAQLIDVNSKLDLLHYEERYFNV